MKSHGDDSEIPTAKGSAKRANLAKDEKIKSFWENLADDWLRWRKSKSSDHNSKNDGSKV